MRRRPLTFPVADSDEWIMVRVRASDGARAGRRASAPSAVAAGARNRRGARAVAAVVAAAVLVVMLGSAASALFADGLSVPANSFGTATLDPPTGFSASQTCTPGAGVTYRSVRLTNYPGLCQHQFVRPLLLLYMPA